MRSIHYIIITLIQYQDFISIEEQIQSKTYFANFSAVILDVMESPSQQQVSDEVSEEFACNPKFKKARVS